MAKKSDKKLTKDEKKKADEMIKKVEAAQKEQRKWEAERKKQEKEHNEILGRVKKFEAELGELCKKHKVKLMASGVEKKGNHFVTEIQVNSMLERKGLIALTNEALGN